MKTDAKANKCICSFTDFYEYEKYSTSLKCDVKYFQCKKCDLITVPESKKYDLSLIYNDSYFKEIDYGWMDRSKLLLRYIKCLNMFLPLKKMKLCDFGAGNGYLSKLLLDSGFNVVAYEPYLPKETYLDNSYYCTRPSKVNALLMIEVFEHFTDAFHEIKSILNDFKYPELIIFTTILTDNADNTIENWDYLNPDSGHYTLWSNKSLELIAETNGYRYLSIDTFLHVFCRKDENRHYNKLKILSIPPRTIVKIKKLQKKGLK
jgi:hypothetical protein